MPLTVAALPRLPHEAWSVGAHHDRRQMPQAQALRLPRRVRGGHGLRALPTSTSGCQLRWFTSLPPCTATSTCPGARDVP